MRFAPARFASLRSAPYKPLTREDVIFTITVEPEHIPVRGNAMASGDDAADKANEDAIISRLESGDLWAWCCVGVTATWEGHSATEYLGCCSYEDEADFKVPGGYYEEMCGEALARLNAELEAEVKALAPRIEGR